MRTHKLTQVASAIVIAIGLSTSAMAADTSSAMRGKILNPDGNAAANVKITVLHEPSGTIRELVTNESGSFVAKGLRVGGPYTVVIDSDAYSDATLDNIFLNLGDTFRLSTQLEDANMERIQVTGTRFLQTSGGSNSVFGADTIKNAPTFNRDIKDVARLNPLASISGNGELVFAGGNPRSNSLTVDGISQNDDFGLNFGGYPTQQPPVSLDAIDQISVDVSPFSAQKGNFGGGTINAVTKSGTNEFKFSGFAETSTPSMAGDVPVIDTLTEKYLDSRGNEKIRNALDENGHKTFETLMSAPIKTVERFGFNVGGSIIDDKLFYFINYSNWSSKLALDYGFENSGATHEYDITQEQFDRFNRILGDVYGLQDSLGGDPVDTNETLLAKLSWNISDNHRLDFTYQWQDDQDERNYGTGGSTVEMASRRTNIVTDMSNIATKIYSNWSDNFSTEVGISYKDVQTHTETNSDLGAVEAITDYRGPSFEFGTDRYSHANVAQTENLILTFDASYLMDEHEIKFGVQYEDLNLYNLFGDNSKGSWEFASFDDFEDQTLGRYGEFTYGNAYTGNVNDLAYDVSRSQLSLYVEDTFYVGDDITVTAGVRYERLSSSDTPTLNTAFEETYGYSNQENLDGLDIILPRINVEWTATEDLTLSAGVGRFQGGIPNVWYNNPFQNDGLTYVAAPSGAVDTYYGDPINLVDSFASVPQDIQNSLQQGAGSTNYTDPNFKLPSSWRARIATDYDFDIAGFGENFNWTTELMYHVKENEAMWNNTALVQSGVAADGRIIYDSRYEGNLDDNFDIVMTNADDDGRSIILSTALAKSWDNGISMTMSYTHQDVTENSKGGNSRAQSNYDNNVTKSRNVDFAGRGYYEVEHMFKFNLNYVTQIFEGYDTNFNLYFERRSGRPFSWVMGTYRDSDFGDTYQFNSYAPYLPYIPSGADDPNVSDQSTLSWEELEVFLDQAGISERGEILDRNTGTQPWVTTMDISIKQEFAGFADGHKGQLFFMIDNFANLLNEDWGVEKYQAYNTKPIYDFGGLDNGKYILEETFGGADTRNYSATNLSSSGWQLKIGVNYRF